MDEEEILIDRPMYVNEIKGFIDKPLVKVITGIRRSGKSQFLKLIQREISKKADQDHIVEMNFERSEFFDIKSYVELAKYVEDRIIDKKKYYVFLDEVQEVDGWEKAVNSIRLMNTDIYVTGSNSKLLDTDYSTLLGGRTVNFNMYPLSFKEFIHFGKERGINENSHIDRYIELGGFPPISMFDYSVRDARRIVTDIHNTALYRDVVKRNSVKNPQLMDKIVAFLYDNVGNLTSPASITNYLKSQGRKGTDPETIINYMRYLEEGFIIRRAQRYDLKGKRLLETNDKYYLTDHSLQYVVRDLRIDNIQGILENIVYMELIRRGYNVYVGKFDTREIDFVAEKINGERTYLQVCLEFSSGEVYNREFAPLKEIKDNFPKYVVSMDRYAERNDDGVIGIHLRDFLLKEDKISEGI
ncbi:MAG: ATP-binding protein [Methanomassiliicoccaceae archaeon]|jgi:predicted AAA+ superfamily ATPase|nr:ATP-binding protein [Methanomassiliicoccaceae archaeon]